MADLSGKTIAIIASDFFEEAELVQPRDALRASGATVRVYSDSGEAIQAVEGDTEKKGKVEVDGSISDLDTDTIDALVVPGGTVNADTLRTDEDAQAVVKAVDAAGKPLAVICHGPWLLVSSGLVDGKRLTSFPSLSIDVKNAGGDWVDEEVVVDGHLITSRNPDDIPAFIEAIETALA